MGHLPAEPPGGISRWWRRPAKASEPLNIQLHRFRSPADDGAHRTAQDLRRVRAPLAHVANQVFLDLANELEAQGVSRKVSADMFEWRFGTFAKYRD